MPTDFYHEIAEKAVTQYGALQKVSELEKFLKECYWKPCRTIVEIGSHDGGMLYALSTAWPEAEIISITLEPPKDNHGALMIYGDSHDRTDNGPWKRLRNYLDTRRIDLLFIDGDHSFNGVSEDYVMYAPLANRIAFHDIANGPGRDALCQVPEFWKWLTKSDHTTFTFYTEIIDQPDHWGGIGIV